MRLSVGLSEITGDVVLPAPADRVYDARLLGLAVRSDHHGLIGAHRVFLLIQGTTATELKPLVEVSVALTDQSFRVKSEKARCLLSAGETFVDLHSYCDFSGMLQYRLDKDVALVLASAWEVGPGSARPVVTIEHMVKITNVDPVRNALMEEWKAVLTQEPNISATRASGAYESPQKAEYWDRPVKKLRRMESEATP